MDEGKATKPMRLNTELPDKQGRVVASGWIELSVLTALEEVATGPWTRCARAGPRIVGA